MSSLMADDPGEITFFAMRLNKAVFLDRDDTLIHDRGYLDNVQGISLLPGVVAALKILQQAGFMLVVVSNQSGIGRGYFTAETVRAQHAHLKRLLKVDGVYLTATEFCPHTPEDKCQCRKPQPGMLLRAARKLHLDLAHSYMVGDKISDAAAGRAAGCRTALLNDDPSDEADFTASDMPAVAAWIVADAAKAAPIGSRNRRVIHSRSQTL